MVPCSQDHHESKNSVQKTIFCHSTPNAPDDGRISETCRAKNTSIKLPCCIKLAFQILSWGRCTVKQPWSCHNSVHHILQLVHVWNIWIQPTVQCTVYCISCLIKRSIYDKDYQEASSLQVCLSVFSFHITIRHILHFINIIYDKERNYVVLSILHYVILSRLRPLPQPHVSACSRGQLKCDGTRAETRFRLSAKRTSPFKPAGASVQSTTGSRGVRISGNNAGYTMFRGSVKSTVYPLHSPASPSLPLPCVTVCHHISTGVYHLYYCYYYSASNLCIILT